MDSGFDGLESIDQIRARKWLGEERIHELEEVRQKKAEERAKEPIQLSLWDVDGQS